MRGGAHGDHDPRDAHTMVAHGDAARRNLHARKILDCPTNPLPRLCSAMGGSADCISWHSADCISWHSADCISWHSADCISSHRETLLRSDVSVERSGVRFCLYGPNRDFGALSWRRLRRVSASRGVSETSPRGRRAPPRADLMGGKSPVDFNLGPLTARIRRNSSDIKLGRRPIA